MEDAAFAPQDWPRVKGEVAVTEELGSEVNLIFHMAAPPVHHDIMIARFDKAAKDEVEAEELAGEGQGLWTARVNPKTQAKVGRTVDLAVDTSGFHSSTPTPAWPSAASPRAKAPEDDAKPGPTRRESRTPNNPQSILTAPGRLPSSWRTRRWGEAETG